MAIDATGTPTSLGIPKYDTAVDNPSGKGVNAMMDAIDALFQQTPNAAAITGIVAGTVPVWDGSKWVKPTGTPTGTKFLRDDGAWAEAAGTVQYGTSLPGSPTDGLEYILVDSTSAPTYMWRFRYNASSGSAYKWEFIGGTPAISLTTGGVNIQSQASYTDNNGPSFTVPRAGDYDVTIEGRFLGVGDGSSKSALLSYAVGATAASDSDAAQYGEKNGDSIPTTVAATRRKTGLSASDLIEERTRMSATIANTWTVSFRQLSVIPVRVS